MATVVIINPNETNPFVRIRGALKDTRPILTAIGAILEAGAQQAFDEQRFGSFRWPGRYPNQSEPFISIAGAVGDFNEGSIAPKGRRFDRRPALRDRGILVGSIRSQVTSEATVEVGSTVPYAATHQWGLASTQKFTSAGRKRMARWLLTKKGKPYMKKLVPLLHHESLDTEVVQRPFLGVTPQMEDDIQATVESMIAEAAGGGS